MTWLNTLDAHNSHAYEPISAETIDHVDYHGVPKIPRKTKVLYTLSTVLLMILSSTVSFIASARYYAPMRCSRHNIEISKTGNVQPRVELGTIARTFEHDSDFTLPPPSGPGSGNVSEPIWDSLIPKGLGYVSHPSIPTTSIPTVFHQLHCLYTIRRAYYDNYDLLTSSSSPMSPADLELQRFDLGKDRSYHVGHCFDFLQQGLTCSADSTLEPAIDEEHEFLGSGFPRQCRDYEALKAFTEKYRVFESEGFLAEGIDVHGGHSRR